MRLSRRLEALDGVHHVVSLANALDIRAQDGDLKIEAFLEQVPQSDDEAADVLQRALDNPIYAGNLVTLDGRATAILVYLEDIPERELLERGIDLQVRAIALEEAAGASVWVT